MSRPHRLVLLTILLDAMCFSLSLPALPALIVSVMHVPVSGAALYAGWLNFTYALTMFLCGSLMGAISDRFGRRPALLASLAALALYGVCLATTNSIIVLFVARALCGVAGATFGVAAAYISDGVPADQRSHHFAKIGAAFGIGMVIGPVIGGFSAVLGVRAPFLIGAALAVGNLVFAWVGLPESLPIENRRPMLWQRANPVGVLVRMVRMTSIWGLLVVLLLHQFAVQMSPNLFPFFMIQKFHWDTIHIGALMASVGILLIVFQGLLAKPLYARFGNGNVIRIGLVLGALSYVGFACVPAAWMVAALLPLSAFSILSGPGLQGLMTARVDASTQGELQGIVGSLYGLALMLAPVSGGALLEYSSHIDATSIYAGAPFILAAIVFVVAFLVFNWTQAHHHVQPSGGANVVMAEQLD